MALQKGNAVSFRNNRVTRRRSYYIFLASIADAHRNNNINNNDNKRYNAVAATQPLRMKCSNICSSF